MKLSDTAFALGSVQVSWRMLLIAGCIVLGHYILFGLLLERKRRTWVVRGFVQSVKTGLKQFPGMMKFLCVEFCVTLMGLTPLLFLFAKGNYRYLAFLAYPMWLLVVNPMRMNAAAAMQDSLEGHPVFSWRLVDFSRWRDQVISGTRRMLVLMLWTLPLIGAGLRVLDYWKDTGKVDAFTWIDMMKEAGDGDLIKGIISSALPLVVLLGITAAILIIGIAFHSGARHALALGKPDIIRGHHGKLVLGWLCSLLFLFPMAIAVVIGINTSQALIDRLVHINLDEIGRLGSEFRGTIRRLLIILGIGGILTLLLMPFRSLVIAGMVNQLKDDEQES